MPRALISVSDKTGVIELARDLAARGFELVSTGGTAAALAGAGLPVVGVADVTGFPEMMDGRVKTLHPLIHAGILARRNQPADLESLARHGIRPIDLVVVNLILSRRLRQKQALRSMTSWSRSILAVRALFGRPPRTSATCSWSSNHPTTRGC